LISDSQSGYLPIIEAIQEAVDDLKAHQFAMSMSVQDALKTTIQHHFSPQKIRSKLEKDRSILNKIPLQREAKLWSMFEALYSEIEQEASETFELLLEREIAKAYKLHSMELNYHRKVQKRQK
jgi:predicted component of type VI protein secretion system